MKCPKCGYLGYERVERCRNCGYEFSLSSSAPTPDLRLRDNGGTMPQPLDDLELVDSATNAPAPDRYAGTPDQHGESGNVLAELPLFGPPITDDVPLITKPSPPRPPLAVRRATPEVPRLRSEARAPLLDWNETSTPQPSATRPMPTPPRPTPRTVMPDRKAEAPVTAEPAGIGSRAAAALIDVALLAVVDFVVVYFTMKICRLSTSELALLPKAPLLGFLLLQNGGYFVTLTATGQTLGKMIAGVRVLADDSDTAPDVGRCTVRALMWILLALPAGLGLLTAGFSSDRRGLHDRLAHTRVVRAGA